MTARRVILVGAVLTAVAACAVWAYSLALSPATTTRLARSAAPDEAPGGRARAPSDMWTPPTELPSRMALTIEVTRSPGVPVADAVCSVFPLDESGKRADDATDALFAEPQEAAAPLMTLRTDAAGRAVAENLERGVYRVTAEAPGLSRTDTRVSIAGDGIVRIALGASLAIGGTVRRPDGSAVAGLRLIVAAPTNNDLEPDPMQRSSTTSGADGTWRVDRLPPGRYDVWIWRLGRGFQRQGRVVLHGNEKFDLTLTDGGVVRGRVTDVDTGNGIAGVRVVLWDNDWSRFAKTVAGAVTVADGTFSAPTYAENASVAKITFARAGQARTWTTEGFGVSAGETHEVNVAIHRESRIVGHVIGPDGPVAGATICVFTSGTNAFDATDVRTVTSGADGAFAVGELAAGEVALGADAPNLVDALEVRTGHWMIDDRRDGPALDDLPAGSRLTLGHGETRTFDLKLVRPERLARPAAVTIRISGTVMLPGGLPAAGAEVWTSAYVADEDGGGWSSHMTETIAASDGTFSLAVKGRPGNFGVQARVPGHDVAEVKFLEPDPKDHAGVVVQLVRLPSVRGRVRATDGASVGGAQVRLARRTREYNGGRDIVWDTFPPVVAADDGAYELFLGSTQWPPHFTFGRGFPAPPEPDDEYVVAAELPDHAPAFSRTFTIGEATAGLTADLVVGPGVELRGRVVDAVTGAGIVGARVTCMPASWWASPSWPPIRGPYDEGDGAATSGPDGRFILRGLVSGRFALLVSAATFADGGAEFDVPAEPPVVIRLLRALPIAGVVVGPDSRPVRGAEVTLRDPAVPSSGIADKTTNADGTFRFEAVPAGNYEVSVVAQGRGPSLAPRTVGVVAGTADLRIRLETGSVITGRLLDAEGRPVADADIDATHDDLTWGDPGKTTSARTDADGRYSIPHLAPGTYTLSFGESIAFDDVTPGVPLELRYPGTLAASGVLVDPDGGFCTYGWFAARRVGDTSKPRPVVLCKGGDDGGFRLEHLAPGTYELTMDWPAITGVGKDQIEWTLPPGTTIDAGAEGVRLRAVRKE